MTFSLIFHHGLVMFKLLMDFSLFIWLYIVLKVYKGVLGDDLKAKIHLPLNILQKQVNEELFQLVFTKRWDRNLVALI